MNAMRFQFYVQVLNAPHALFSKMYNLIMTKIASIYILHWAFSGEPDLVWGFPLFKMTTQGHGDRQIIMPF